MSAQLGMGSSSEVQCPAVEVATTSDSGDQTTETARPGLRSTPSDGSGELPALMSTHQGMPLTSGTEALMLHREGEEPFLGQGVSDTGENVRLKFCLLRWEPPETKWTNQCAQGGSKLGRRLQMRANPCSDAWRAQDGVR